MGPPMGPITTQVRLQLPHIFKEKYADRLEMCTVLHTLKFQKCPNTTTHALTSTG